MWLGILLWYDVGMELMELVGLLRRNWDAESAFDADDWSGANPARGQCAVSSLVIQEYMGGEIVRFRVEFEGIEEKHFVNLIDGALIDSTHSQFPASVMLVRSDPDLKQFSSVRERLLSDADTERRYGYLLAKIQNASQ